MLNPTSMWNLYDGSYHFQTHGRQEEARSARRTFGSSKLPQGAYGMPTSKRPSAQPLDQQ